MSDICPYCETGELYLAQDDVNSITCTNENCVVNKKEIQE